jgi:hypothetical protein
LAQASGTDPLMGPILMDTTGIPTGTAGSLIGTTGIVKGGSAITSSAALTGSATKPLFWSLT